jgi:ubiquinone/menaquinone biosynthesis C-methylase UbiE
MLAGARDRAPSPPVELVEGDATRLPFPDAAFDAAASAYGVTAVETHRPALSLTVAER